jgi:hypothetical protein
MLIEELGFSPDDIIALTNGFANRDNIRFALEEWAGDVEDSPSDKVLFYYSGHGTFSPDLSPSDESDGYDEHLALGEDTVRDDELEDLLDVLDSQNRYVWVDSCFAGGMARSLAEDSPDPAGPSPEPALVKSTSWVEAATPTPPRAAPAEEDGFVKDLDVSGLSVLAAAGDHQESVTSPQFANGLFTYFLVSAYTGDTADGNGNGRVSAEEAHAWLAPLVDAWAHDHFPTLNRGDGQDPQLHDGIPGEAELELSQGEPTTTTTLPPPEEHFVDVPQYDPYFSAVEGMAEAGIMNGYETAGGPEFRPSNPVWRWQFAKMISGVLELPVSEPLVCLFSDMGPDDPDKLEPHDYVAAATSFGIIRGYTDGTFRPYTPIRRAHVFSMVVRALLALRPESLEAVPAGFVGTLGVLDPEHGPNLRLAEYNGLAQGLVGFGSGWDPWANMSRAEAAQVLWNVMAHDGSE